MRVEIRVDRLCRTYHVVQHRRGEGWHRVSRLVADVLERYAGVRQQIKREG